MLGKQKSSPTRGGGKVREVMREYKHGELKSGRSRKKIKSRKQAIAIALSEARRAGARIPKKVAVQKSSARRRPASKRRAA